MVARTLGSRVAAVWASPPARAALLGLGCLAGAELGHALSLPTPEPAFAAIRPAAGVLLAALVLARRRFWPVALATACAASLASDVLLHHRPALVGLGLAAAACGEACLGAWLLGRFVGRPVTLARA